MAFLSITTNFKGIISGDEPIDIPEGRISSTEETAPSRAIVSQQITFLPVTETNKPVSMRLVFPEVTQKMTAEDVDQLIGFIEANNQDAENPAYKDNLLSLEQARTAREALELVPVRVLK